jgi:hypothetical protein
MPLEALPIEEVPPEAQRLMTSMGGRGKMKGRKLSPEQEKYLALIRSLTENSVTLVLKLATCACEKKDSCMVFKQAQSIANIIDQIQETRPVGAGIVETK